MKPPPFTYHAPSTTGEALDVLARAGPDGKVLAGGQSLIPIMNMRLATPAHLVDINGVSELDYVQVEGGGVRVGAGARHADVERDEDAQLALPLLRQALGLVAHPVIRNRGTVVGSLAHADPSGEMTAVLALVGGSVELASSRGSRTVTAGDFFVGPMEPALADGELATSAYFPRLEGRTGTAFREVARRHGDYALCGVAAAVTLDDNLCISRARAAYLGVSPVPLVLELTSPLVGEGPASAEWDAAGRLASEQAEPEGDIHASEAYRRQLAHVLTVRALAGAADAARTAPTTPATPTTLTPSKGTTS